MRQCLERTRVLERGRLFPRQPPQCLEAGKLFAKEAKKSSQNNLSCASRPMGTSYERFRSSSESSRPLHDNGKLPVGLVSCWSSLPLFALNLATKDTGDPHVPTRQDGRPGTARIDRCKVKGPALLVCQKLCSLVLQDTNPSASSKHI